MLPLEDKRKKSEHLCTPFDGCYRPSTIRWWHTLMKREPSQGDYSHMDVLNYMILGHSAEDAESLTFCHQRVIHERAGHRVTGEWCVCLSEPSPSAGEARGSIGSDGFSTLLSLKADLQMAADQLPISWSTTQQIFEAQGRNLLYQGRFLTYRQNLRVREIDHWSEPRDPETGRPKSRSLAFWLMSRELKGVRDVCAWPKPGSIVERDVFRVRANPAQQLEEIAA